MQGEEENLLLQLATTVEEELRNDSSLHQENLPSLEEDEDDEDDEESNILR